MADKLIRKTVNFEIKDVDGEESSFLATASDEGMDRDGDIISMDAWDLKGFKQNPVVPLFHDYRSFPVAKATKVRMHEGKLMFRPVFAVNENPQAKIAFDLYKGGFMNAFSVGFLPKEFEEVTRKDGRIGRDYTKVELLEISAVLVPSNPNALVEARSKGINVDLLDEKEPIVEPAPEKTVQPDVTAEMQVIKNQLDDLKKEIAKEMALLIMAHQELCKKLETLTPKFGMAEVNQNLNKLLRNKGAI
jgi:HK97 family phage prohead protease